MTEQLCVRCLLEDDDCRPKRREGHVQTTAAREGPELRGEVLQVGPRGVAQELEHVIVEALCSCTIDHYIRHRQYLEKKGGNIYKALRQNNICDLYQENRTHGEMEYSKCARSASIRRG